MLACDFLYQPGSPTQIKNAGYDAVLLYLRATTVSAVEAYLAAGLGVGLIFETAAAEATSGGSVGTTDGQVAVSQAQGLGAPGGAVIFVNIGDFAATPSETADVCAYLAAWSAQVTDAGYTVGAYGTRWIIEQMVSLGASACWWQNAMDDQGSLGSVVSPHASLYQRVTPSLVIPGGGGWDEDEILGLVSWWGSTPTPVSSTEGADMAAFDPVSKGSWFTDSTGEVYAVDGAPYLGGLNNHPQWQAGGSASNGPALGVAYWEGDGTDAGGLGYVIATRDSHGNVHPYNFPRSAVYA
jgi:hypothetical protein